jgi:DNA helicase-2/ATP-dependent DNA helicase PcrA
LSQVISSNILAGLNPQQLEAVTLAHLSALILAGAGSGKTRVLTTRVAWLIQTGQVSPHGILAVTFTNKASREMLTRISAMLPINTRGMWVGTFHGLCNRMLRAHHRDAGLPQTFQILDTQDQLALIKRLLKGLNVDEEKYPPRDLQYFISGNKEAGRRASSVEAYDEHSKRLIELYAEYDRQCNREGVVDFAELLLRCFELLSRNEILREHYRRRFSHILVDEFQDTNRLQYLWLKLLAATDNAIFAVGDDDQSIYAFRGASAQNMFEFDREFAHGRVIKLEQNYRSQGKSGRRQRADPSQPASPGQELWTGAGEGEPLRFYQAPSDVDEAAFIVQEVKACAARRTAVEMALLYRSNAQSRVLGTRPVQCRPGLSRVWRLCALRAAESSALFHLRLAANPKTMAFLRVVNLPARGSGQPRPGAAARRGARAKVSAYGRRRRQPADREAGQGSRVCSAHRRFWQDCLGRHCG